MPPEILQIGCEYFCESERRGLFQMRVSEVEGQFVTGTVTRGIAYAKIAANVRYPGGKVTVNLGETKFTNLKPPAQKPCLRGDLAPLQPDFVDRDFIQAASRRDK